MSRNTQELTQKSILKYTQVLLIETGKRHIVRNTTRYGLRYGLVVYTMVASLMEVTHKTMLQIIQQHMLETLLKHMVTHIQVHTLRPIQRFTLAYTTKSIQKIIKELMSLHHIQEKLKLVMLVLQKHQVLQDQVVLVGILVKLVQQNHQKLTC